MKNSEFAAKRNNPSEGKPLKNTPVHAFLRIKEKRDKCYEELKKYEKELADVKKEIEDAPSVSWCQKSIAQRQNDIKEIDEAVKKAKSKANPYNPVDPKWLAEMAKLKANYQSSIKYSEAQIKKVQGWIKKVDDLTKKIAEKQKCMADAEQELKKWGA